MLFIFFLSVYSAPKVLSKLIDSYTEANISIVDYDEIHIKFETNYNVIAIFNRAGFTTTVYPLSREDYAFSSPYTYFVIRFQKDWIKIVKNPNCLDTHLRFTAIPNFKEYDDNKIFFLNSYTNISIGQQKANQNPNIALKTGEYVKLLFLAPVKHDSVLKYDNNGLQDFKITYLDSEDTPNTLAIDDSGTIQIKEWKSFVLSFKVKKDKDLGLIQHINSEAFDFDKYPFLFYSADISDFTTSFYPPNDIADGSPLPVTNEVCMCKGDASKCIHCPNGLIPYLPESTNQILKQYVATSGIKKCNIYIDGTEESEFSFDGLSEAEITITSLGYGATLKMDMSTSPKSLSLYDIPITFSQNTVIKTKNLYLSNVQTKITEKAAVTIETDKLETDFDSLNNFNSIKTGEINFVGNVYPTSISNGVNLVSPGIIRLPISLSTVLIKNNNIEIGDLKVSGDAEVYFSTKNIVATYESSSYAYTFVGYNSSIYLFGDFPTTTKIRTGGHIYLYTKSIVAFIFTEETTVSMLGETALYLNWISFRNCNMIIDTAGIARITLQSEDSLLISNRQKEVIAIMPKSLTLKNEVSGGYLELFVKPYIRTIPILKYYVYDNTTTVFGNWDKYNGIEPLIIKAEGVFLNFRTFDSTVNEEKIRIYLSDNKLFSSKIILPYATPAPTAMDYSGPVAAGTIGTLLLISIVIFVILFTACGNLLGLKTFGPWGSDPYKYKDDDQEGEIIDLNL